MATDKWKKSNMEKTEWNVKVKRYNMLFGLFLLQKNFFLQSFSQS